MQSSMSSVRFAWIFSLALALVTLGVYWPGRGGEFALDDFPNIVDNAVLHVSKLSWPEWLAAMFSSPASELQRPLAMLSFAINIYFTGLDALAMKFTNIGIHVVNGVLAYLLVAKLIALAAPGVSARRRAWAAAFVATAWTLHPIQLTSVLYVVQRMESLAHSFVFVGLLLYVAGRERQIAGKPGWGRVLSGLVLFSALGTLSKESAALLPLYAFFIEACVLRFRTAHARTAKRLWAVYAIVLLLPAVAGGTWLLMQSLAPTAYANREFTLVERLLTEGRVLVDYLRWILVPNVGEFGIYHDDYPVSRGWFDPVSTLPAWFALAALAVFAAWLRARRPLASLGIAWFLAAHVLTASFLPLELVYEHRNYFAALGVFLALGDLLLLVPAGGGMRRIGALCAVLAVLAYSAATWTRAYECRDPYQWAASEAAKRPNSPRAAYGLARMLVIMSGYRADSPFVQPAIDALERARRVPGSGVLPHSAYFLMAANLKRPVPQDWWNDLEHRLRTRVIGPQEMGAIASIVRCSNRAICHFEPAQIEAMFAAAAAKGPRADIVTMHGDYVLNTLGDRERALALWRQAAALSPEIAQYRINLTKLLILTGHHQEARAEIAVLRTMGVPGQFETHALDLERRLAVATRAP